MRNRKNGPLSYAPAFVTLFGICFSLYASYLGYSPLISAVISVLAASSWVLTGTPCPVGGWNTSFVLVILLAIASSFWLNYSVGFAPYIPSTIRSEGKVLQNRQWGRRRALLISTDHGKMAAYSHPFAAPAEGSGVSLRGAVFDFKRSNKKNGFDEYLYWRSMGAVK